jgi:endonuclease/exonuclease/phosphatase family metal-dependent hydrolase
MDTAKMSSTCQQASGLGAPKTMRSLTAALVCAGLMTIAACNPPAATTSAAGSAAKPAAVAGADPAPKQLVVMTWNVEWMFDDDTSDNRSQLAREQSAPSADHWQWKVDAVADAIAKCDATIVALQEIEGAQTLSDIAGALRRRHHMVYRAAFIQGSDSFTEQDVGILQRSGLMHYRRHEQSKMMFDSELYYNVSKHIVGMFQWQGVESPLTIMNVHLRATADAESERSRQGRLARAWLEPEIAAGEDVIILGDLNSEHSTGEAAGEMLYLLGGSEAADGTGASDRREMVDLLSRAAADARRTHLILDKQFDRILVSPSLMVDDPQSRDWVFSKIVVRSELVVRGAGSDGPAHWSERLTMPIAELDVSDHSPVVATFELR